MFLTPAAAKHYKPQNTRHNKIGGKKRPAANPQTRNFRLCGRAKLAFLRALRLAPQSTKSQQKSRTLHSGIRIRNRQYAYMLVPRPLLRPSMLVLAGQNRNGLFRFFFVYKRFSPPKNYLWLPPLCTAPNVYNPEKIQMSLIKLRARLRSLTDAIKIFHWNREPRNIFPQVS